jgi:hypothetical protein
MQSTYCDVCRKKVDNPVTTRNFFYLAKHGICEPCKDNLEFNIRSTMRNKDPYAVEWYSKMINDSLEKGVQKGKI